MTRHWTRRGLLAAAGTGLLAGCSAAFGSGGEGDDADEIPYDTSIDHDERAWSEYDPDWSAPTAPPTADGVEPTVLVENLEIPWDLAFAPTGEVFLTERTGTIRRFEAFEGEAGEAVARPGEVIDAGAVEPGSDDRSWWVPGGEGGLLGIAVHPAYPDPPLVYAYYTTEIEGDARENVVAAFDVSADDPAEAAWRIVEGIPGDNIHNGGRLEFGPAGYLWITTGDAGDGDRAQDTADLGGKVLRVEPDGRPPADNPDTGGDPRVFTYGHRNPQGISWLPDATPVVTEHGPGDGDEVNVLRPGGNYGWPEARDADSYAGTDYRRPVANAPSWAPSGSVFYTGDALPGFRDRLLFGGLVGQTVVTVTLSRDGDEPPRPGPGRRYDEDWYDGEYQAAAAELFEDVLGRVRHVEQGPDGELYAITSNRDARAQEPFPRERDDVLVRLDPAE